MKYIIAVSLLFLSLVSSAQDIKLQLANANKRKWVGANIYQKSGNAENTTTLTFYTNQTVVEGNAKYKSEKKAQKWWIVSGDYVKDNNIVIQIGDRSYNVEFSRTNNGKDFLTLTYVPEEGNTGMIIKTYVAE